MIELIERYACVVVSWAPYYLVPGLFCLLWMIRSWRSVAGTGEQLKDAINELVIWSLLWPAVLVVQVFPWKLLTWEFWLQPVTIPGFNWPVFYRPWWWRK